MMPEAFEFSRNILDLSEGCAKDLLQLWASVDKLVFFNQAKVLRAFTEERISLSHLWPSTGYGYGDHGREAMDKLYARVFGGEAAMVRLSWTSGTHVLKTALFSLLRPGDEMLSVTGQPYETLRPVIGTGTGSLASYGVSYNVSSCLLDYETGHLSEPGLEEALGQAVNSRTRVIFIQRSRGYSVRPAISMKTLETFTRILAKRWPGILTLVDNCYCEFVEEKEPPSVGIAVTAGSLIKNPGGGLAPTGGYVAGKREYIDRVADALYAPGISGEVGSNPYGYRDVYQGIFLAPKAVGEALKGAIFAALFFRRMGYEVDPGPFGPRSDIVQSITTGCPEFLRSMARSIQRMSPIDSYATPEPWDMPGYENQVIMAAGTFVQGSSIELSCDGPFAPPYIAYLQGGLTKEHTILACMHAGQQLLQLSGRDVIT